MTNNYTNNIYITTNLMSYIEKLNFEIEKYSGVCKFIQTQGGFVDDLVNYYQNCFELCKAELTVAIDEVFKLYNIENVSDYYFDYNTNLLYYNQDNNQRTEKFLEHQLSVTSQTYSEVETYKRQRSEYPDYVCRLFKNYYWDIKNEKEDYDFVRNITLQITNDCCCNCTYCYEINKNNEAMTIDTAKTIIDLLFELNQTEDSDDSHKIITSSTKGIILDFIGGEPLMNIDVLDFACRYFYTQAIRRKSDWAIFSRFSLSTNGKYYFSSKFQKLLNELGHMICLTITLDGPKEIHDACRVYHDGSGNFDDAYRAFKHFKLYHCSEDYPYATKVTISPDNLKDMNKIVTFFMNENVYYIHLNPIFEHEWSYEEAQKYYKQLKLIADTLLQKNDNTIIFSPFEETCGHKLEEYDNNNWCGGTGRMLAFSPDGIAYPCIRYTPISLGENIKPFVLGSKKGLLVTEEEQRTKVYLDSITRRSQSTDECFNCSIASGCSWCSAWNYQETGSPDKRSTNLCHMHKARTLVNAYYWNNYYIKNNINKYFSIDLSKEESLKIISEEEYNELKHLEDKAKKMVNNNAED